MKYNDIYLPSDIVNHDLDGAPIYKMNVRDILYTIGFELKNGEWVIKDDDPKLSLFPTISGTGYITNVEDDLTITCLCEQNNVDLWKNSSIYEGAFVENIDEPGSDYCVWDIRNTCNGFEYYCFENVNVESEDEPVWINGDKLKIKDTYNVED